MCERVNRFIEQLISDCAIGLRNESEHVSAAGKLLKLAAAPQLGILLIPSTVRSQNARTSTGIASALSSASLNWATRTRRRAPSIYQAL